LEKLLQDVTERKCQMIESQLAQIEAAKQGQD
jgi:hypothetical protein